MILVSLKHILRQNIVEHVKMASNLEKVAAAFEHGSYTVLMALSSSTLDSCGMISNKNLFERVVSLSLHLKLTNEN